MTREPRHTIKAVFTDALNGGREWMDQALCATKPYSGFTEMRAEDQRAICTGYGQAEHARPVRAACAAYAVEQHSGEEMRVCQGVVYGGVDLPEMRRTVRAQKRARNAAVAA